jgi:hypothetical protein
MYKIDDFSVENPTFYTLQLQTRANIFQAESILKIAEFILPPTLVCYHVFF